MFAIDRRIPLFLALAAALSMIALTGWQGYRFWQSETNQATRVAQPATSQERTGPAVPEVGLANFALFGARSEGDGPAITDTENLPETNLRLSLRGVLAADGDFPGSALVEDDKNNTEAYLVGDELPGNAKLRTVFANRVVSERTGKLENLYFPENEDRSRFEITSTDQPKSSVQPQPVQQTTPRPTATATATASSANDQQRREEIRQRLEQLQQRLQNNN